MARVPPFSDPEGEFFSNIRDVAPDAWRRWVGEREATGDMSVEVPVFGVTKPDTRRTFTFDPGRDEEQFWKNFYAAVRREYRDALFDRGITDLSPAGPDGAIIYIHGV